MKLLFLFIIALYCVLSLVLAQNTCDQILCPDQVSHGQELPFCKPTGDGKCKCGNPLPNGECPDTLPACGAPHGRNPNSCTNDFPVNHSQLCKGSSRKCSEIHYSENLDNKCKCPLGTKAWPILTSPWEIKYELQDKSSPYGPRYVYTINHISPGPTIHAIKDDWILIPVFNNITNNITTPGGKTCFCPTMTTLHWHGISMRGVERQTPWSPKEPPGFPFMDGVPGVSQCPIPACGRFDYYFQFVDSGTYWYHSHYEIQIADGLSGIMMVKDCNDVKRFETIYNVTYNEAEDFNDYIINFKDWFNETTAEEEQKKYMYNEAAPPIEPIPNTGLINNFSGDPISPNLYKTFKFTRGKTYRLRLINTSVMTLFNFSIDNHEFEVVEIEGMIVERNAKKPNKFKHFNINVGQRVSILVTADQTGGTYWMRFHSKGCYFSNQTLDLFAVVCYNKDVPNCPLPQGKVDDRLNINITCEDTIRGLKPYCSPNYTRFCNSPPNASETDTYYFRLYIYKYIDDDIFNISKIDAKDPWKQNVLGSLSGYNDDSIPETTYLAHKFNNMQNNNTLLGVYNGNVTTHGDDNTNIFKLDNANRVYDIVFINSDPFEHPIHLHGHFFYVIQFGNLTTDPVEAAKNYTNFIDPIQRDVFTLPPRGFARIRFTADNPGVWPMHCHMDWHLGIGMMAQFMELPDAIIHPDPSAIILPPETWYKLCKIPNIIYRHENLAAFSENSCNSCN